MTPFFNSRQKQGLFWILATLIVLSPVSVSAHTLETDGTIEATLHVSPGHHPTAGENADLEFAIKDSARSVESGNYALILSVEDEQGIATMVPVTLTGTNATAPYIFPHEGDYVATLTGSSTVAGSPPFELSFDDIVVLPPGQHESRIAQLVGDHGGHLLVTGLIVLIFVGVVGWEKYRESRRKKAATKNP